MLNENWQVQITDFGTAKQIFSANQSENSTNSNISFVSGLSNISAISGISGFASKSAQLSANSNEKPQQVQADDRDDELVGSEMYISPEMVETRSYSYSSDLWALGIMLFQFLVGKTPFKGKTQDETFELIKKCEYEVPKNIDANARDLIQKLLVKEPEARIGAFNIHELMDHPFFDAINFGTIGTDLPPQKFELTPVQQSLIKYLPHMRKQNSKGNSSANLTPNLKVNAAT